MSTSCACFGASRPVTPRSSAEKHAHLKAEPPVSLIVLAGVGMAQQNGEIAIPIAPTPSGISVAQAVTAPARPPPGRFSSELVSFSNDCCICWMTLCCSCVPIGQLAQRYNPFCGTITCKIVTVVTLILVTPYYVNYSALQDWRQRCPDMCPDEPMPIGLVASVLSGLCASIGLCAILCTVRSQIRRAGNIPATCCPNRLNGEAGYLDEDCCNGCCDDDFCSVLFCTSCETCRLLRHVLADKNVHYSACSDDGSGKPRLDPQFQMPVSPAVSGEAYARFV